MIAEIVQEYMRKNRYSLRRVARELTEALANRPVEPRSVSYNAVYKWVREGVTPEAATMYFIANNPAARDDVRALARRLLEARYVS